MAHGNSIRALVKYLDDVSEQDIVGLNIPNGQPLVYELDEALKPTKHYFLEGWGPKSANTGPVYDYRVKECTVNQGVE